MKIAIDVDDCISNTIEVDFAFSYRENKKMNPDDNKLYVNNYHNAPTIFGFTPKQDDDFFAMERKICIDEDLIKPKVYSQNIINKLFDEGNEIVILTSRSDKCWGDAQKQTIAWLTKYGFKFSKCLSNVSSKGIWCKENGVDLLIDDNPKYLKQANDEKIKTITFYACYNADYKNELNVFANCWFEVYDKIKEIKANNK